MGHHRHGLNGPVLTKAREKGATFVPLNELARQTAVTLVLDPASAVFSFAQSSEGSVGAKQVASSLQSDIVTAAGGDAGAAAAVYIGSLLEGFTRNCPVQVVIVPEGAPSEGKRQGTRRKRAVSTRLPSQPSASGDDASRVSSSDSGPSPSSSPIPELNMSSASGLDSLTSFESTSVPRKSWSTRAPAAVARAAGGAGAPKRRDDDEDDDDDEDEDYTSLTSDPDFLTSIEGTSTSLRSRSTRTAAIAAAAAVAAMTEDDGEEDDTSLTSDPDFLPLFLDTSVPRKSRSTRARAAVARAAGGAGAPKRRGDDDDDDDEDDTSLTSDPDFLTSIEGTSASLRSRPTRAAGVASSAAAAAAEREDDGDDGEEGEDDGGDDNDGDENDIQLVSDHAQTGAADEMKGGRRPVVDVRGATRLLSDLAKHGHLGEAVTTPGLPSLAEGEAAAAARAAQAPSTDCAIPTTLDSDALLLAPLLGLEGVIITQKGYNWLLSDGRNCFYIPTLDFARIILGYEAGDGPTELTARVRVASVIINVATGGDYAHTPATGPAIEAIQTALQAFLDPSSDDLVEWFPHSLSSSSSSSSRLPLTLEPLIKALNVIIDCASEVDPSEDAVDWDAIRDSSLAQLLAYASQEVWEDVDAAPETAAVTTLLPMAPSRRILKDDDILNLARGTVHPVTLKDWGLGRLSDGVALGHTLDLVRGINPEDWNRAGPLADAETASQLTQTFLMEVVVAVQEAVKSPMLATSPLRAVDYLSVLTSMLGRLTPGLLPPTMPASPHPPPDPDELLQALTTAAVKVGLKVLGPVPTLGAGGAGEEDDALTWKDVEGVRVADGQVLALPTTLATLKANGVTGFDFPGGSEEDTRPPVPAVLMDSWAPQHAKSGVLSQLKLRNGLDSTHSAALSRGLHVFANGAVALDTEPVNDGVPGDAVNRGRVTPFLLPSSAASSAAEEHMVVPIIQGVSPGTTPVAVLVLGTRPMKMLTKALPTSNTQTSTLLTSSDSSYKSLAVDIASQWAKYCSGMSGALPRVCAGPARVILHFNDAGECWSSLHVGLPHPSARMTAAALGGSFVGTGDAYEKAELQYWARTLPLQRPAPRKDDGDGTSTGAPSWSPPSLAESVWSSYAKHASALSHAKGMYTLSLTFMEQVKEVGDAKLVDHVANLSPKELRRCAIWMSPMLDRIMNENGREAHEGAPTDTEGAAGGRLSLSAGGRLSISDFEDGLHWKGVQLAHAGNTAQAQRLQEFLTRPGAADPELRDYLLASPAGVQTNAYRALLSAGMMGATGQSTTRALTRDDLKKAHDRISAASRTVVDSTWVGVRRRDVDAWREDDGSLTGLPDTQLSQYHKLNVRGYFVMHGQEMTVGLTEALSGRDTRQLMKQTLLDGEWKVVIRRPPPDRTGSVVDWLLTAWERAGRAARDGLFQHLHPNQWVLVKELGLPPGSDLTAVREELNSRTDALNVVPTDDSHPAPSPAGGGAGGQPREPLPREHRHVSFSSTSGGGGDLGSALARGRGRSGRGASSSTSYDSGGSNPVSQRTRRGPPLVREIPFADYSKLASDPEARRPRGLLLISRPVSESPVPRLPSPSPESPEHPASVPPSPAPAPLPAAAPVTIVTQGQIDAETDPLFRRILGGRYALQVRDAQRAQEAAGTVNDSSLEGAAGPPSPKRAKGNDGSVMVPSHVSPSLDAGPTEGGDGMGDVSESE